MELTEAIKILKHHQKWRLGSDIEMTNPKKLSQAIDCVIMELELKFLNLN